VDALASLLDGPRARGAFLLRTMMDPPWSIRIQDHAPLTLMAMMRGDAWLVPDSGPPTRMRTGDVVITRGPAPYTVADEPDTEPQILVHPDQRCTTMDGRDTHDDMTLGVRTWGNAVGGSTVITFGTYQVEGEVTQRLLSSLPEVLVLPDGAWDSRLVALLDQEVVKEAPGQEVVLDRLLDLVLIAVLRAWFSRPEANSPAWYHAQADPVVGRALRMIYNDPAHPWTVAALADRAGVSRAALARRFTELVGEPPLTFLTGWRIALAADLLRASDDTVDAVARKVGYGSGFALSTAFKRIRGISPQQYRLGVVRS
jgi:AraC-like DNA-binding protein